LWLSTELEFLSVEFPEIKKPEKVEDETADWKTYRNEEYGFEVRYLPDWKIYITQPDEFSPKGEWGEQIGELAIFQSRTIGAPYCELHLTIYSNPKNLSIRDFWRERLPLVYNFKSSESITFGENQISGVKFLMERTDQPLPNESMAVAIEKNDHIIELFWWGQNPTVANPDCLRVDQMLSTFKLIEDETANWNTYRGEEYGFEVKYPEEIKQGEISYRKNVGPSFENCDLSTIIGLSLLGDCYKSLAIIEFPYYWEESPFQKRPTDLNLDVPICYSRVSIQILEKPSQFSSEKAKEIFKKSKYVILSGIQGLRRNEFIGLPPGGGGDDDIVYLPKESKLYLISLYTDREITGRIGFPEDTPERCLNHQMEIFNQMLSTFKFLK